MKSAKKAQLGNLQQLVIGLVIVGMVLVIGLSIMGKTSTTLTTNSAEKNAADAVVGAMDDIPGWLPVVVIATIGIAVLAIVLLVRRIA